jgi:hypothetical protein
MLDGVLEHFVADVLGTVFSRGVDVKGLSLRIGVDIAVIKRPDVVFEINLALLTLSRWVWLSKKGRCEKSNFFMGLSRTYSVFFFGEGKENRRVFFSVQ